MSSVFINLKKHWITLVLLIASVIGVRYVVKANRTPGSVSVIEAQSMDMATMMAPVGLIDVSVAPAELRSLNGSSSFPATVRALSDEDVVTRVAGRVSNILVYPGDRVHAGQLVAVLGAPDLQSNSESARQMARAKETEVAVSQNEVVHHHHLQSQALATVKQFTIAAERARLDAETTGLELDRARTDLSRTSSVIKDREADLNAQTPMLERQQSLFKRGAISLEELQQTQKEKAQAQARLDGAKIERDIAIQTVAIAKKKRASAMSAAQEAQTSIEISKIGVSQADEALAQAKTMESVQRQEAAGARATAESSQAISGFQQLKASAEGVVAERLVSPGTAVMAGQVILRLHSLESVRVQIDVPITVAGNLSVGSELSLKSGQISKTARLTSIFPDADPQSRTVRVEAIVSNRDGSLRPGQFLRAEFQSAGPEKLSIPSSAVNSASDGYVVWVAAPAPVSSGHDASHIDWTCTMHPEVSKEGPGDCPICKMTLVKRNKGSKFIAVRRIVSEGSQSGDWMEIKSGLRGGEMVITSGFLDLVEGAALQIKAAK